MKKDSLQKYSALFSFLICVISCVTGKDEDHFLGEIVEFRIPSDEVEIAPELKELDGVFDGIIAVHDTLAFFWSYKYADSFFAVFNLKNKEYLGNYSPRGQGPEDTAGVPPIYQFYKEDNDLKTVLFAPNNSKLFIWNITESLKQKTTIYDNIIPYVWRNEHLQAYTNLWRIGTDTICTFVNPPSISGEEGSLQYFQLRTISTNKPIQDIHIYKNPIKAKDREVLQPHTFLWGEVSLKPDGSKAVQAMMRLAQINIIDLKTEKIKGFRVEGTEDFSLFYGDDKKNPNDYYRKVVSSNDYIFALWAGVDLNTLSDTFFLFSTIHIFDWDGNFVRKIKLTEPVKQIWFDQVNNLLYGYNNVAEKLYRYDLKDVKNL